MKSLFLHIFLFLSALTLNAQVDSLRSERHAMSFIPEIFMDEITIMDPYTAKLYNRTLRYVKFTYPYANLTAALVNELELELAQIDRRRKRKKHIKRLKKDLKGQFKTVVAKMTEYQGEILCKTIHQKTGMTVYEIIKKYNGTTSASIWQTVCKLGGADLTQTFQAPRDWMLNEILTDIKNKKISVAKYPVGYQSKK